MTSKELAALIPNLSVQYLADLRYLGKGPTYYKVSGKIVLYAREDVEAWLESKRVVPQGD